MARSLTGLAAAALLLFARLATARTGPNPDVLGGPVLPGDPTIAKTARVARAPLGSTPVSILSSVPLPSGAVQLDSTYYDLQDLGSLGTRIVIASDGSVHVTWEDDFCELDPAGCPPNPNAPVPFAYRGMGYAYRNPAGTWTNLGKVRQPSIRCSQCSTGATESGGFGTIAIPANGRAAISQHMDEDGCDERGDMYLEDAVSGSSWTAYLSPISDFLFPQVAALANGSFDLLGETVRVTSGCTHCGVNDFGISRLAAAGSPFVCPTGWQFGAWASQANLSLFRNGYPEFPCLGSGSDGRVGIAVTDFGGNVYLIESRDGTFASGTITTRNLTNYHDSDITASDSTSTQYRPYIHCHLAYNDTTPNVVWSELQARRSGSSFFYTDWRSRIRHWNPVRGVSTVKQVQAGEADHYDDLDQGLSGPTAGFNTISVDWPEVGFSADGQEIYVVWVRFLDSEADPNPNPDLLGIVTAIGFGDLAASVARGTDAWSAPQNLTSTPNTDERYPSIALRNSSGAAHLLFQASATNQAGIVQAQDRGASPNPAVLVRRIAYLERTMTASVSVSNPNIEPVSALRIIANPTVNRARFAWTGGDHRRAIEIYSVNGQRIARLSATSGPTVEWNGTNTLGRVMPGGLYLARIAGEEGRPVKFVLLH